MPPLAGFRWTPSISPVAFSTPATKPQGLRRVRENASLARVPTIFTYPRDRPPATAGVTVTMIPWNHVAIPSSSGEAEEYEEEEEEEKDTPSLNIAYRLIWQVRNKTRRVLPADRRFR